jgi:peptidoglycan/LPS O-acetylase OafA/YrhL
VNSMQRTPAYRSDIDGLRAIAVAAVVLYHAEVPGFGGGYVGVDVFFVISGYLITQLLAGSAAPTQRLRLRDFYIRRARRILPALCVTSLTVALAGVAILLPWDLARLGSYLAATPVLAPNIAVWIDGGYFKSRMAHVPIAHFWSIAIEEQFYLIYPITFWLICKYLDRYRTSALIALAVPSFAVCVWGSYHAPSANYLLPLSRGWELLLGGALATSVQRSATPRLLNELFAMGALVTLGLACFLYAPSTPYPGVYALAPCAASAILIHTGCQQRTVAGKLLSARPLVFTGLISYSLYLWHFPVLVLYGYYNIRDIGAFALVVLLGCIYAVAAASWKWIELPIRTRAFLAPTRSFLMAALIVNTVVFSVGVALWKSNGLPWRFPPDVRARGGTWHLDNDSSSKDFLSRCLNMPLDQIASGGLCSFGPRDNSTTRVVVWGDSHALVLLPLYRTLAISHHLRLYFAVRSGCRPLLGSVVGAADERTRIGCSAFNAAVTQAVRRLDPRVLILNGHWIDADSDLIPEPDGGADSGGSNFARELRETLRKTASINRSVCVVLDVPTFKYNLPNALAMARRRGIAEDFLKLSRAQALQQYQGPERDIRALEQRGMVRSVDPKDLLCPGDSCIYESDGNLLYQDTDHLSLAGAQLVSSAIEGCFRDIAPADTK